MNVPGLRVEASPDPQVNHPLNLAVTVGRRLLQVGGQRVGVSSQPHAAAGGDPRAARPYRAAEAATAAARLSGLGVSMYRDEYRLERRAGVAVPQPPLLRGEHDQRDAAGSGRQPHPVAELWRQCLWLAASLLAYNLWNWFRERILDQHAHRHTIRYWRKRLIEPPGRCTVDAATDSRSGKTTRSNTCPNGRWRG